MERLVKVFSWESDQPCARLSDRLFAQMASTASLRWMMRMPD